LNIKNSISFLPNLNKDIKLFAIITQINEQFFDILNAGEDQVFLQPKILLKLFGGEIKK